ncbi:hypothetical protein ELS19_10840 [Halogeometricum borinquense]|uniref:DUF8135 domain-containing protein n=1 Tax=Halogeometricum borinquense TaxID=60847 RepID=A0A482T9R2_9EURY|nr:hypothetical protein [Halogeometricum borinquense]RYJ14400.1 hypothetical protein ELS19_10840 [Halogeometricum borinquense]
MTTDDGDDEPLSDIARRVTDDDSAETTNHDAETDEMSGADSDRESDDRTTAADGSDATNAVNHPEETNAVPDSPAPTDDDVPLSDLARRVARRRKDADDSDRADSDDTKSLFESMDVEEIDSDTLWAGLVEDESATISVGARGAAESIDDELPGYEDYIVPKSEFCHHCPYFADPPELACTHDGTEIVEVVEMDRFRVRDCPMVEDDD